MEKDLKPVDRHCCRIRTHEPRHNPRTSPAAYPTEEVGFGPPVTGGRYAPLLQGRDGSCYRPPSNSTDSWRVESESILTDFRPERREAVPAVLFPGSPCNALRFLPMPEGRGIHLREISVR
jgi:hypothetical protein